MTQPARVRIAAQVLPLHRAKTLRRRTTRSAAETFELVNILVDEVARLSALVEQQSQPR